MIEQYRLDGEKRLQENLPPLPLTPIQTSQITKLIEQGDSESSFLLDLLSNRVEPGVSKSAQVKASWLKDVACARVLVDVLAPEQAVSMLAQMGGGYNVEALIELLKDKTMAIKRFSTIDGKICCLTGGLLGEDGPVRGREVGMQGSKRHRGSAAISY